MQAGCRQQAAYCMHDSITCTSSELLCHGMESEQLLGLLGGVSIVQDTTVITPLHVMHVSSSLLQFTGAWHHGQHGSSTKASLAQCSTDSHQQQHPYAEVS